MRRPRDVRFRLWSKNPHCCYCNVVTLLPTELARLFKISDNNIGAHVPRIVRDRMATIEHINTRFNPKRYEPNTNKEKRLTLACHKCNIQKSVETVHALPKDKQGLLNKMGGKLLVTYIQARN